MGIIDAVTRGQVPLDKYLMGATVGALLGTAHLPFWLTLPSLPAISRPGASSRPRKARRRAGCATRWPTSPP